MRMLRTNQRGPDVEHWQRFLADQGLVCGPIDGIFGEATDAATRAFQRRECLDVDGIVGPNTLGRAHALGFASFRRLRDAEVTPALAAEAKRLLALHHAEPYCSEYPFEVDGRRYLARLEQHYHEPGGPLRPWGYHPGISLFVTVAPGSEAPLDGGGCP
jgi:peptidoglycan hydrolase-like protein with peptidoglycan-binding domain